MGQGTERTEPRRDIGGRRRGEPPERADTESRQQIDEVVEAELGDHREHGRRQKGEELGGTTCGSLNLNVFRAASGELGGERAVGHPDDWHSGDFHSRAQHFACECNDPFNQRGVSAEVTRGPMRHERDACPDGSSRSAA